jgi:hypothetical protein
LRPNFSIRHSFTFGDFIFELAMIFGNVSAGKLDFRVNQRVMHISKRKCEKDFSGYTSYGLRVYHVAIDENEHE